MTLPPLLDVFSGRGSDTSHILADARTGALTGRPVSAPEGRERYDVRRSARSPRNPRPPMTVPNTKETTASVRCTQKYAVG